jgi:hypothetical protein
VRPGGGGNEACGEEINSSFYVIDPLRTCIVEPTGVSHIAFHLSCDRLMG